MPRARQERLIRQFFTSMPVGAQLLLYLGIFCCFAPLGLLQPAFRLQLVSWWEIVVMTIFSGSIAIVFAVTAIRAPRWIGVPILVHLALTFALVRLLPERPAAVTLDAATLDVVAARLRAVSVLTIGSQIGAFICFLTLIRREGLRFTSAHTELRLARDIHATLVPAVDGRVGMLEWRGRSRPSGDVGGDLVDVVAGPSWCLATVADVSGHGVASGVMMGMYKTAFRTALDGTADVGALTTRINRVTSQLRQSHMFITAACLHVTTDGTVSYVLAGHPPMLHLQAATGRATWVGESQLALALLDDASYDTRTLMLAPGDVLLAVTDGLLEVFDRRDRELGPEGLQRAVERAGARAALEVIEAAVFAACHDHGIQTDDQTLLLVRRRP